MKTDWFGAPAPSSSAERDRARGGEESLALKEATDAARAISGDGAVDQALVTFGLNLARERDAFLARPKRKRGRA